jgi:hypothetical protein
MLLREHSCDVVGCLQHDLLESLLSFQWQHDLFLIPCSIFCCDHWRFSVLTETRPWAPVFKVILSALWFIWQKMFHHIAQFFAFLQWILSIGCVCMPPCFSHGSGCLGSLWDLLCGCGCPLKIVTCFS